MQCLWQTSAKILCLPLDIFRDDKIISVFFGQKNDSHLIVKTRESLTANFYTIVGL